jgi:predicted heme/steroid binding protein
MPLLWKVIVSTVAVIGAIHASIKLNQEHFDRFVMGIVRDVGRYKARKRRFKSNASTSLIATLLHRDDPLQDLLLRGGGSDVEKEDESNLPVYTLDELEEFGDGEDGRPLLLAIFGRVYDVTAGKRFYGANGPYGDFRGHDVTYSLCTGCRTEHCLSESVEKVENPKLLQEGKRWLSFFHLHDKYPLVGKLEESNYLAELMKGLINEELSKERSDNGDKPLMPPILEQQQEEQEEQQDADAPASQEEVGEATTK